MMRTQVANASVKMRIVSAAQTSAAAGSRLSLADPYCVLFGALALASVLHYQRWREAPESGSTFGVS